MADQEEDFSSLPLRDRYVHKNWKVRKDAYEESAKAFDSAQSDADPVVRDFTQDPGLLKGAVSDSNVAAQQEGLVALCSFLQICNISGCLRSRHLTIPTIAEKGLVSTKPTSKQKSLEALLLYIESDKADPTIEELLPMLSHKQPKVIAATLNALTAIYHEFGVKTVEPKQVLKVLPKVYGHADKNVRAEAQNLTVELYRWLKDAMKPLFWNDLKPVQQQDLEKLFEKVADEPSPKPLRLLRSQQAAVAATTAGPDPVDAATEGEEYDDEEIDLEPEIMSVDVFPKIPKDLHERLASTKWKDRKEALDDLHAAINFPAIDEGPFDEIIRALAKCMKDANIAVVTLAANCMELLAKGLRQSFARYRSTVMGPMMERLKEKKQSVTDAIGAGLDAVFASTNFSDCLDETLEFMKNKNPQVKLESSRFLTRCLRDTRIPPSLEESKGIADSATKLMSDSLEAQRTAAAEILGTLWKIMGDRIMSPFMEGLEDIRKAKVKECYDAAEVKSKHQVKSSAPAKAAVGPPGKKPAGKKPVSATTPRPAAKKPSPPVAEEPVSTALQPKPTSRPGIAKPGAPTSAPRGLKPPSMGAPKGLPTPASMPRPTSSIPGSNPLSPRRTMQTPQPVDHDEPAPGPKTNRGLTGQRLTKPSAPPAEPLPPVPSPGTLSSTERTELDDLRAEVERMRQVQENYRSDHQRLTSQIHELQNQNAQLIEDHTRDVLTIKAKETQLVRARSDAESAEQSASYLQREVDRLKRELGRMGRADRSPRSMASPDPAEGANVDRPSYNERSTSSGLLTSPTGEGKENYGPYNPDKMLSRGPVDSTATSRAPRPMSMFARPNSRTAGGGPNSTALPPSTGNGVISDTDGRSGGTSGASGFGGSRGETGGQQGVESWKRAAEVTQNLKARIELMKAKQHGISR